MKLNTLEHSFSYDHENGFNTPTYPMSMMQGAESVTEQIFTEREKVFLDPPLPSLISAKPLTGSFQPYDNLTYAAVSRGIGSSNSVSDVDWRNTTSFQYSLPDQAPRPQQYQPDYLKPMASAPQTHQNVFDHISVSSTAPYASVQPFMNQAQQNNGSDMLKYMARGVILSTELERLSNVFAEQWTELDDYMKKYEDLRVRVNNGQNQEAENDSLRRRADESEYENKLLKNKIASLQEQLDSVSKNSYQDDEKRQHDIREMQKQIKQLQTINEDLRQGNQSLTKKVLDIEKDEGARMHEYSEMKRILSVSEANIRELRDKNSELQRRTAQLQAEVDRNAMESRNNEALLAEISSLHRNIAEMRELNESYKKEADESRHKLSIFQGRMTQFDLDQSLKLRLENEKEILTQKLDFSGLKMKELEDKMAITMLENERMRSQLHYTSSHPRQEIVTNYGHKMSEYDSLKAPSLATEGSSCKGGLPTLEPLRDRSPARYAMNQQQVRDSRTPQKATRNASYNRIVDASAAPSQKIVTDFGAADYRSGPYRGLPTESCNEYDRTTSIKEKYSIAYSTNTQASQHRDYYK